MSKKHYLSNEDISILCSELSSVRKLRPYNNRRDTRHITGRERIRTRRHSLKRYSAL